MAKSNKITLDRNARIARVLGSQGKSSLLAKALSESALDKLADCCDEKGCVADVATSVVSEIVTSYYDEMKATVDDLDTTSGYAQSKSDENGSPDNEQ